MFQSTKRFLYDELVGRKVIETKCTYLKRKIWYSRTTSIRNILNSCIWVNDYLRWLVGFLLLDEGLLSARGTWACGEGLNPLGPFYGILSRIFASVGENHGEIQTPRSTSPAGDWTLHLSSTIFESRIIMII